VTEPAIEGIADVVRTTVLDQGACEMHASRHVVRAADRGGKFDARQTCFALQARADLVQALRTPRAHGRE
jgi:hypothetical protein